MERNTTFQKKEGIDQTTGREGVGESTPAKGWMGFSQPGVGSSSEISDTGTDSSGDSRMSKKKKKSNSKRRRRLLRLNQYTSTHKKPKSFKECISASMGLACKLIEKGCPVKGFLKHVWFVAEQGSLNRFRPEAILAYDQGVRDKAAKHGLDVFGYSDADNFYRYLGAAALKKETKVKNVPSNRYASVACTTTVIASTGRHASGNMCVLRVNNPTHAWSARM